MKYRHLVTTLMFLTMVFMALVAIANEDLVNRAPANFIPDDDIEITPFEQTLWIENAMQEDDAGVLRSMKNEVMKWQEKREYAHNWNLESTGLYFYPEQAEQTRFIEKNMLKYFDKRLSGEVKKAEEGSTLAKVGKAHQALKPSAEVGVFSKVKIKFKAQILLRQARVHLENPWVQYYFFANSDGDLRMHMKKDFSSFETYANLDYDIDDKYWEASVSKKLYNNIYGTILSHQTPKQMMFSHESDKIIKINYFRSF
ncbi:MAG: hypothetical protein A2381_04825 [Bdellovibrionales bacterium RIFOXYB1_FULL_37_110]|nr:MAG: hypothetical protein A2181_01255 [Bdellovibrionales bacterium RIFOXYA1_FULL_38_20]OFZ50508.1 MAG: hypothetical protein A2417_10805 [Bdellovibrionales bacterium RIFOXYC1_FULL_37_79]OFZ60779.1 MAG: hypothetical protein A2381_04825 [Bdellovibrionales bacterium RIFOXYB1_FULL_37_110]OFZ64493.1 MAG: hypothetical protein A2577_08790 [Bdellovibrionales bacterium RIFOXYD1_FULL_36_51]